MKRTISLILAVTIAVLSLLSLASCQPWLTQKENEQEESEEPDNDTSENTPEDVEPVEPILAVNWNCGYVGSLRNEEFPNAINTEEEQYSYTDVIEMGRKGTKLTFTDNTGLSDTAEIYSLSSWIKDDGEWIIDLDAPNIESTSNLIRKKVNGSVVYTYVSTKDNECIRFCYRTGDPVTLNGKYPDIYIYDTVEIGTAKTIFEVKEWANMDKERIYYEILQGKTINFIGDSLFGGHTLENELVWTSLLAEKYRMPYYNYGINGCTISACEGGANPIINRYTSMADNDPDIIVFEGGRNDYNKSAPLGVLESREPSTYRGAVAALIEGLREKYPDAVIIGITFWNSVSKENSGGYSCNDYSKAMLEVCDAMGVACIDATDAEACGVYMTEKSFREQYALQSSDVCHLNREGMKLVFPFFEKRIAEIYAEAAEK